MLAKLTLLNTFLNKVLNRNSHDDAKDIASIFLFFSYNTNMTIISCSYKKRVGKDTFCRIVQELFPDKKVIRVAFADELKEELDTILLKPNGISRRIFEDPKVKEIARPLLQGWGTIRREFCDINYWVKRAFWKMNDPNAIYIITDARYLNEIEFINSQNGHTVHIKRNLDVDSLSEHSSETELDNYHHLFKYTIENYGTEAQFKEKIKDLMDKIFAEAA